MHRILGKKMIIDHFIFIGIIQQDKPVKECDMFRRISQIWLLMEPIF